MTDRSFPDARPPREVSASPSEKERTMALLGHALTFVEGGIVGPAVLYLFSVHRSGSEPVSPFVAFHALQSLLWGLLAAAISLPAVLLGMGLMLLSMVLGERFLLPMLGLGAVGMLVGGLLILLYFAWEIWAAIKAWQGEWYRLPLVGRLAARVHTPDS